MTLTPDAEDYLVRVAGGDARRALTALEGRGCPEGTIDAAALERAVDRAAVRYDRAGDQHYDVTSAFIKSMRGGRRRRGAALPGPDGRGGRGPAVHRPPHRDPRQRGHRHGRPHGAAGRGRRRAGGGPDRLPEGRLTLAQAVIHCCLAPKSNAVYQAINEASADVRNGLAGPVPAHLRDASYPGAARLGHGDGYRYPHDFPAGPGGGVVAQQYAPDAVAGREYYRPGDAGAERAAAERLAAIRHTLRGAPDEQEE